jgi:hypothetical protein
LENLVTVLATIAPLIALAVLGLVMFRAEIDYNRD